MNNEKQQPAFNAFHDLVLKVNEFILEEQGLLDEELARMGRLVQEAVANLHKSFNAMSDKIVRQSEELQSQGARDLNTEAGKEMKSLLQSTHQISSIVVQAVISLQFEDIVQQLILHSRQRITEIQRLMQALQTHMDELVSSNASDGRELLSMVEACQDEINKTRQALTLSHPAKQESLNKGDVTLF
ncbi:MAG TPA: hypothetical protein VMH34_03865 [Gammaproteobacteria bacterium]|nr:hypothetical protein [Gammaproteobacteria bacterium]